MKTAFLVVALVALALGQDAPQLEPMDTPQRTEGYGFSAPEPIWKWIVPFRIPGSPRQITQDVTLAWMIYLKDTTGVMDLFGMIGWNYFNTRRWQVASALSINAGAEEPIVVIGQNQSTYPGAILQYQFNTMVQPDNSVDLLWGIYSTSRFSRYKYPLSSMHLQNLPLDSMPQYEQGAIVQVETDSSRHNMSAMLEAVFLKKKSRQLKGAQDLAQLLKAAGHRPLKTMSLNAGQIAELELANVPEKQSTVEKAGQRTLQQFNPNVPPQYLPLLRPPRISPQFVVPPRPTHTPRVAVPRTFTPRALPPRYLPRPPRSFFNPAIRPPTTRVPRGQFPPAWIPLRAPKADPPQAPAKCAIYPQQAVVFNDIQAFGESGNALGLTMGQFNDGTIPDDECTSLSAVKLTTPSNSVKISFEYDDGSNTGNPLAPRIDTTPLQQGCCMSDSDCGKASVGSDSKFSCVLPFTRPGTKPAVRPGVCKKNASPYCWSNADCAKGQTCNGATVCPCGARCFTPDRYGKCGTAASPPHFKLDE